MVLRSFALMVFAITFFIGGFWVVVGRFRGGFEGSALLAVEPYPLGAVAESDAQAYEHWVRPSGPPRVALQAGHWKKDEVPEEQNNLRWNGAVVAGIHEVDVTLRIAREARTILENSGVIVDILPTTVPPGYVADAFVAIHADKHADRAVSGYKVASSASELSGASELLAHEVESSYGARTGMQIEPNVSDGMRDYYAFNWRQYTHALHPMTPAMILEAGFLSNTADRRFVTLSSAVVAQGVADGLLEFLRLRGLLD